MIGIDNILFLRKENHRKTEGDELEEAMLLLHNRIEKLLPDCNHKVIQFAGSHAGEGTSTITAMFATVLAKAPDKSVLIIDADRDNPVQHLIYHDNPQYNDLEEIASDEVPVGKPSSQMVDANLSVCIACKASTTMRKFFDLHSNGDLWDALKRRFDYILIDSPPITASSDGLFLASKVDGIVLVVEADNTRWPVVDNVKERLTDHGGNILGVVFNKRRFYIPKWIYKKM